MSLGPSVLNHSSAPSIDSLVLARCRPRNSATTPPTSWPEERSYGTASHLSTRNASTTSWRTKGSSQLGHTLVVCGNDWFNSANKPCNPNWVHEQSTTMFSHHVLTGWGTLEQSPADTNQCLFWWPGSATAFQFLTGGPQPTFPDVEPQVISTRNSLGMVDVGVLLKPHRAP